MRDGQGVGPVFLYCRGLRGECEDGYGTLRGESGSTRGITILMMGTRESGHLWDGHMAAVQCIIWRAALDRGELHEEGRPLLYPSS